MSPNNRYKTTCNTLYHIVIEISSVLSRSWLFFYLPSTWFPCFWIELIKDEKNEGQIQAKSNCASSVCVQTNAPHARWGSTPSPLNIIGQPMMSWKAYPGIIGNRSALSHGNTFIYHLVHCRCHLVNMKGQNKLFLVFSFRSQHT